VLWNFLDSLHPAIGVLLTGSRVTVVDAEVAAASSFGSDMVDAMVKSSHGGQQLLQALKEDLLCSDHPGPALLALAASNFRAYLGLPSQKEKLRAMTDIEAVEVTTHGTAKRQRPAVAGTSDSSEIGDEESDAAEAVKKTKSTKTHEEDPSSSSSSGSVGVAVLAVSKSASKGKAELKGTALTGATSEARTTARKEKKSAVLEEKAQAKKAKSMKADEIEKAA